MLVDKLYLLRAGLHLFRTIDPMLQMYAMSTCLPLPERELFILTCCAEIGPSQEIPGETGTGAEQDRRVNWRAS